MFASLVWWLAVQVIALCAVPLCLAVLRPLADRGWGFSKAFGLLLFSYTVWLLGHVLPNGRPLYVLVLVLIAGGSALVVRREGARALLAYLRQRRGLLLLEEGLFLAAYLGFLVIRSHNADISGTEKFMDFAFLNATARSAHFPALDPWLAPSAGVPAPTINYYYFGYLIQGLLLHLTGVLPAEAFNLALTLLFALAALGAFSLGYTITRDVWVETRPRARRSTRGASVASRVASQAPRNAVPESPVASPGWSVRNAWQYVAGGLLTAYLLLVSGNLWSALRRFDGSGMWDKDFWSGVGWNATRVLVIKQGQQDVDYTINEFPAFSFLLGDLHTHVLALPFALLAVGLAYAWLIRPPALYRWAIAGMRDADASWLRLVGEVLPGALILGSLYFLNSWDFPAYFLLAQAGAMAGAWWQWRREQPAVAVELEDEEAPEGSSDSAAGPVIRAAGAAALVGILAGVLFAPFILTFKAPVISEAGSLPLGLVPVRSYLSQFFQFWGIQLLLLTPVLLTAVARAPAVRRTLARSVARAQVTAIVTRGDPGSWEPALYLGGTILLVLLADRLGSGVLALCALVALGAGWATWRALDPRARAGGRPLAFAFGAICLAALLLATCEVVYIRDFYGGSLRRMNTVFKLYYQAWLLLAIGGAAGAMWLLRRLRQRLEAPGGRVAYYAYAGAAGLLLLAGLLFPYRAALLRTDSFKAPATLDGMDWLKRFHPEDYAAAQWLRQNGPLPNNPTPVVLEASEGPYSEFARVATQTGFPTVLGWDQHERLWRGASINAEVDQRKRDIDAIYNAATLAQARPLLDKYHVTYIMVGYLEQQKYGGQAPDGRQQFLSRMSALAAGGLQPLFTQGQTTIYRVPPQ